MKVLERVLFLVKYLLENNNDFKEIINRKGSNVGKLIVVIILFLLMIGHGVGGYIFYKFKKDYLKGSFIFSIFIF